MIGHRHQPAILFLLLGCAADGDARAGEARAVEPVRTGSTDSVTTASDTAGPGPIGTFFYLDARTPVAFEAMTDSDEPVRGVALLRDGGCSTILPPASGSLDRHITAEFRGLRPVLLVDSAARMAAFTGRESIAVPAGSCPYLVARDTDILNTAERERLTGGTYDAVADDVRAEFGAEAEVVTSWALWWSLDESRDLAWVFMDVATDSGPGRIAFLVDPTGTRNPHVLASVPVQRFGSLDPLAIVQMTPESRPAALAIEVQPFPGGRTLRLLVVQPDDDGVWRIHREAPFLRIVDE